MDWFTLRVGWLGDAYKPDRRAIGLFRILYGIALLAFPVHMQWTVDVPRAFFDPGPGLPGLVPIPPSATYVLILQVLHVVTAVWLVVGWRTRVATGAVVAVGLLEYSLVYSFGKIDHSILFQLVPVVMVAAGWGASFSLDARRGRRAEPSGLPLVSWSVIIAFAFATAALAKAAAGWWSPNHYGARSYAVDDLLFGSTTGPLLGEAVNHLSPLFWKLIDLGTLFAEGWLVIAIISPRLFRAGLVMVLGFHVSVYLVLGIDFSSYAFVYLPFFLATPRTWFAPSVGWADWKHRFGRADEVTRSVGT